MIVFTEDPMESIPQQQQKKATRINKFRKVEAYRLNTQNSIIFLHANNKQLGIEIKIGMLITPHKIAGRNKMR